MAFAGEFEQWDGREVLVLSDTTVLIIFAGKLKITRQANYFGMTWCFELKGNFLVLTPGTYVVDGKAQIFFAAENGPQQPAPPPEPKPRPAAGKITA